VYVRRIPEFDEQSRNGVWQTITDPLAGTRRVSELVPVWTRETFEPIVVPLSLGDLYKRRRLRVDLSTQLNERLRNIDTAKLFPGRRPFRVDASQIIETTTYEALVATLTPTGLPLGWRLVIDVRLVPYPTDPTLVRVAARVINQSPPASLVSLDYVDANVYAVSFDVEIPRAAHRSTVFEELPASFRFNREMPGVGINGHVESTIEQGTLTLHLRTVPIAAVPRLEPTRRWSRCLFAPSPAPQGGGCAERHGEDHRQPQLALGRTRRRHMHHDRKHQEYDHRIHRPRRKSPRQKPGSGSDDTSH
jgi:hypothetical protein